MKITLIKPNIGRREHSLYIDEGRMEPLQLGVLAGMTPPDIEVALIDDRCEEIAYDSPTDLVAITVETFTARRAYEISAEYRLRGVTIVLGGFHPTLLPEEAKLHADSIIVGDAESVWDEVMADAGKGKIRPVYRARPGVPQSGILPRRDIFKGKGYLPLTLVQFGRGCRNACTFCTISAYFKQTHTHRPIKEVVNEIEQQGRKIIFFVDDNIAADREATKELLRALIPLHINWVGQGSIDMTHDPELMELMAASGCLGNVIGFESIDPKALSLMKKIANLTDFDVYEREIQILKRYGLQTWAAFILGVDQDTPESLYKIYDFALKHRFTFAAFNVLMPYPNTPLYQKLHEEGRLLYDGRWWLHPEYRFNHAAFKPARMTADELTQIAFDIRSRWNSFGTIFKRSLDLSTNMRTVWKMAMYWKYNSLFRKETLKKQSMRFGRL
jgi:radical SAM superfamily enzyme YgiQ (UPF0313 family)